ncbi:MAG TPA: hypothetical protein VMH90_07050 [Thermoplasmata archaeon]|nr:hypothetical protein [Thermoplasmata archaeon]
MTRTWPPPEYRVEVTFHAPSDFVFKWCTDYTSTDAKLEGEAYVRKIVKRSKTQVIYEDLEEDSDGWFWTRHLVRLSPPDHWHSDSIGSHREYSLDYRLTPLGREETRLTLTARRRPTSRGPKNPSKAKWEGDVAGNWKLFARALERDYRRSTKA